MFLLPPDEKGDADFSARFIIVVKPTYEFYPSAVLDECVTLLQEQATARGGLAPVQVFADERKPPLYFDATSVSVGVSLNPPEAYRRNPLY